jgi:F0F1-type ATP synthase assembly protein I
MLGTIRNALPRVRLVSLVRSCYVFLLSCYLGGIVIVQPFLLIEIVACFANKKTPTQTTLSLASETSKKILLVLVFSSPCVFYP